MSFKLYQTWAGAGVKVGGFAFIGLDTFEGVAFRLDGYPQESAHLVNMTNLRLGIGLGGQIGVSLIFVFNANTLWEANGQFSSDWGVNIAVPQSRLSGNKVTLQALKGIRKFKDVTKFLKTSNPEKVETFRNIASILYSGLADVAADGIMGSEPKVVIIDVPGAGLGAEISANFTGGEFSVDKSLSL